MEIFDERKTFEKYSSTPQKPRFRTGKSGWKSKRAKSPLYEPFDIQRNLVPDISDSATFTRTNYTIRQLIIFKSAFYAQ